jgi:hypothetical protein
MSTIRRFITETDMSTAWRMSAFGGGAEYICSDQAFLVLTDIVAKVFLG